MGVRLYQFLFRFVKVKALYRDVVVEDRLTNVKAGIREDITRLLSAVNADNPFFKGKFTEFLAENESVDEATFFANYAKLPALSKTDYATAGQQVMSKEFCRCRSGNDGATRRRTANRNDQATSQR